MRIDIITILPELLTSFFSASILKKAINNRIAEIHLHNLRDYATTSKYKKVDDYAYGGGAGMVMMIEPIDKCISALKNERNYDEVIFLCPDGELWNQKMANQFSTSKNLILLCGHYKGVDQRVRDFLITKEISIGDYVLSGGEIAAAVLADSLIRLIPGAMNDETSALTDSFQDDLLAPPVYTRPAVYKNLKVPQILMSGNEAEIDKWRLHKAMEQTKKRRPNL